MTMRAQRVTLDAEPAEFYGVPTNALVQAVKCNTGRFPGDFMFRLTAEEFTALRSQSVASKPGRGGRRALCPYIARRDHAVIHAEQRTRKHRQQRHHANLIAGA